MIFKRTMPPFRHADLSPSRDKIELAGKLQKRERMSRKAQKYSWPPGCIYWLEAWDPDHPDDSKPEMRKESYDHPVIVVGSKKDVTGRVRVSVIIASYIHLS
jgi:hypothetical protein